MWKCSNAQFIKKCTQPVFRDCVFTPAVTTSVILWCHIYTTTPSAWWLVLTKMLAELTWTDGGRGRWEVPIQACESWQSGLGFSVGALKRQAQKQSIQTEGELRRFTNGQYTKIMCFLNNKACKHFLVVFLISSLLYFFKQVRLELWTHALLISMYVHLFTSCKLSLAGFFFCPNYIQSLNNP